MSLPSVRIPLLCLLAVLAVAAVAPAADAKSRTRGTPCAAAAGALRPSPLRACVRTNKAPRALPSARRAATAARPLRRRGKARIMGMMGRLRA